jgi:alkylation response protein AidB-like acyl-CoA dehydrogenase
VSPGHVIDRASARRFVDEYIVPVADGYDRDGRVPDELLARVSAVGLWAPFLPVDAGGSGVSFHAIGEIHEEVGRGCSSIRSLLTVHTMVTWAVNRWGDARVRDEWLPRLASGDALGAVCITEPDAGSDTAGLAASAKRTPYGWRINGTKTWITGGQRADVFLVYAQGDHGLAAFLVARAAAGVEIEPIADVLGTRASMLATVRLHDVEVGRDALVGPESFMAGMVLTGMLDIGRFSVAAGCVGIVQAALDASTAYTSRRRVGGTRLRDLQLIRTKIANMVTDVAAARLLVERAARLKDEGDPETIMVTWIAKYFASVAAARHAREAVQIHGANGCGGRYPVARLYRDAKVMEIIEASTELQQLTIADRAYQA